MSAKTAGILLLVVGLLIAATNLATIVLAVLAGGIAGITATRAVCLGVGILMILGGFAAYRTDAQQKEQADQES
jgi:hypothetical protein